MCGFSWSHRSPAFVTDIWLKFLNFITRLCGDNESSHAGEPDTVNLEPTNANQADSQAPSEPSSSSWTTITYESEPGPLVETPAQRIQKWVEGVSSGPPSSAGRKMQRVQNWVEGIYSEPASSAGEEAHTSG